MKSLKELSNRLEQLETETTMKPRLFEFPELRQLMQDCEKEGLDHEKATLKICEYYQEHYGEIEINSDPSLLHAMVMV